MRSFQETLGRIAPQLGGRVENVPTLPPEVADEVLRFLVTTACRGQNVRPIMLARGALAAIPREWLLEHVESVVMSCLDLDDEWEYRRILECAKAIDLGALLERLVAVGLNSRNADVAEAARDVGE